MRTANILRLGVKELWGLARDPLMLVLIVYSFTLSIYSGSTAIPETLSKAAIAVVDVNAVHRRRNNPDSFQTRADGAAIHNVSILVPWMPSYSEPASSEA